MFGLDRRESRGLPINSPFNGLEDCSSKHTHSLAVYFSVIRQSWPRLNYAARNISREHPRGEEHAITGYVNKCVIHKWNVRKGSKLCPHTHTHTCIVQHKVRAQREAASCLWVGQDEQTVQFNKL